MYTEIIFHIDLSWESHINDANYLKSLIKSVNIAYQHQCTVCYCKEQLDEFGKHCEDLDNDFLQSYGDMLDILLANAVAKPRKYFVFAIVFANDHTTLQYYDNLSLSILESDSSVAIVSSRAQNSVERFLCVLSSELFFDIEISFVNSIQTVANWILANAPERNFNLSPKHGENGLNNWPGESSLLCDRAQAQSLLNKALGDFSKSKRLYVFDDNNHTYVEFYYEGNNPQLQWHGFHLEQNLWEQRVPISLRRYFNHV